jgi:prepilin-type N-terminal cleavage/methylation domain-containing protein
MNLLLAYVGSPRFRRAMGSKPGQKGFSLIELIIAVAVIAILSAAVLPQFANQSVKAANATAKDILANAVKECGAKMAEKNAKASDTAVTTKMITSTAVDGIVKGYTFSGGTGCANNFKALATVAATTSGLNSYCYIYDSTDDTYSFSTTASTSCP